MLFSMFLTYRRWVILGLVAILVLAMGAQLRSSLGIDLDVESVRAFAEGLGPAGPILFIGVVALRSFLALPSQVVLIAAGLCFGTLVGAVVGGAGLMLSGLGIFLGVRYAAGESVKKRADSRLGRILDASGHRAGAVALALGSGYPISPLSPLHAAAGLTSMSIGLFILAAFTGGILRASVFSYFGNAITQSDRTAFLLSGIAILAILAIPLCFETGRKWLAAIFGLKDRKTAATNDSRDTNSS